VLWIDVCSIIVKPSTEVWGVERYIRHYMAYSCSLTARKGLCSFDLICPSKTFPDIIMKDTPLKNCLERSEKVLVM